MPHTDTRELTAAIRRISAILERYAGGTDAVMPPPARQPVPGEDLTPLTLICDTFGLGDFERDILVMCASIELDADCAAHITSLQNGGPPTFALALAALPGAHWSALLPTAPLRNWQLIEVGDGPSLVSSPLRIDERVLHALMGLYYIDPRLAPFVDLASPPAGLTAAQRTLAGGLSGLLAGEDGTAQIHGGTFATRRAIAAAACAEQDTPLLILHAAALPDSADAAEAMLRRWQREAMFSSAVRMLVCDLPADASPAANRRIERVIETATGPFLISSQSPRPAGQRAMHVIRAGAPPKAAR